MAYTEQQKREFDLGCYGALEADVVKDLTKQAEFMGKGMLLMSMLSDAQELIDRDAKEAARMLINRVKLVMQDIPENEMDVRLAKHRAQG